MKKWTIQQVTSAHPVSRTSTATLLLMGSLGLLVCLAGCGNGSGSSGTSDTPQPGPQSYFAPYVAGTTNQGLVLSGPEIYALDDHANAFSQTTFLVKPPGPQVINAGTMKAGQRGLLALEITANYATNGAVTPMATAGSFAVELAGQAGGLVQIVGQPAAPLVAATQCPVLKSAQTYQFLTIPAAAINAATTGQQSATWDPSTDTAFGTVDITSDGTNVTFANIHQFILPSVGGSGVPAQPGVSSITGACGETTLGNTITVGNATVTNPIPGNGFAVPPQGKMGIGPSGLLVEHNGSGDLPIGTFANTSPALYYDNTLGAGTGAVGLPKPSSAVDTNALVSAQYLGFIYGAGVYPPGGVGPSGWSSHLSSFGFATPPASCASVAAATSTLIYGGDYPNDSPTGSANGFGNCNLALDLGTQDSTTNGLFPKATVWLGAGYAGNTTGQTYSFSAVAIAGQLNGKNAIFVLGVDSTQPWAIYLLQSN